MLYIYYTIFFSFHLSQEQIWVKHLCKLWNFPSQSHLLFPWQSVSLNSFLRSILLKEQTPHIVVCCTVCHMHRISSKTESSTERNHPRLHSAKAVCNLLIVSQMLIMVLQFWEVARRAWHSLAILWDWLAMSQNIPNFLHFICQKQGEKQIYPKTPIHFVVDFFPMLNYNLRTHLSVERVKILYVYVDQAHWLMKWKASKSGGLELIRWYRWSLYSWAKMEIIVQSWTNTRHSL